MVARSPVHVCPGAGHLGTFPALHLRPAGQGAWILPLPYENQFGNFRAVDYRAEEQELGEQ